MSRLGHIIKNMDAKSAKSRQKKSVTYDIIIEMVEVFKVPQPVQTVDHIPADQKYEYNCIFFGSHL